MARSNTEPRTKELRLVLLCSRRDAQIEDDATILRELEDGVDWTTFARTAIRHGMAGIAGRTLLRFAAEKVPREIADALRLHIEQKRTSNTAALHELSRILEALAESRIDAIVLTGPALALRLDEDLGLRELRDLDFLVRVEHRRRTTDVLLGLGYKREGQLKPAQSESLYNASAGLRAKVRTRLTSTKIALDIDYQGLWGRARPTTLDGPPILMLEPEDDLIALAIEGSEQLWSNIGRVCDIATFIDAHPGLDWSAVLARAKAQGNLRMVLLAVSLAETFFHAAPPESILKRARADARIEPLTSRILARWESEVPASLPGGNPLALDLLILHDGFARRARHITRSQLFSLRMGWRRALSRVAVLRHCLISSHVILALVLSSKGMRSKYTRCERARRRARTALMENPQDARAWCELGDALAGLERHGQAIDCYDRALTVAPDSLHAWRSRRSALAALGKSFRLEEHIENPADVGAWALRAGFCFASRRYNEATAASDRALELDPSHVSALRIGIHSRLSACDWTRREADLERVLAGFREGRALARPIEFRRMCASERENLLAAQVWARPFPASADPLYSGERYLHDRIRVAYMSSDLRDHVVSEAIVGCFEHHDRLCFETTAISLLDGDGSDLRRRVESAFDRFVDVAGLDDIGVARLIRELEIDILVDLNGYAGAHHRAGILAHRPAPLQVSYLGFPGTTAAPFMDYIIADPFVIPEENRRYYTEQVVRLPHSYMPTDDRRTRSARTWTRTEAGLPEQGFVFACHHDERKLAPETFRLWMRLLQSIEHSVLWLKSMNSSAVANLRHEASSCEVAPERLIFAPRLERSEDHLARLAVADLFLDTLPYNAHATAWDALFSGLPLITCRGEGFPGLVASGILHASGLSELVTSSLAEYEALARMLARSPPALLAIRAKLARARESAPFFDTAGHTRNLESAYVRMHERHQAGLPPADLDIAAFSMPAQFQVRERLQR